MVSLGAGFFFGKQSENRFTYAPNKVGYDFFY
jgi:hypothetical protein